MNENPNGLIREFLPKSCDFRQELPNQDIQMIENKLNNRPRKRLEFKTPNEVFYNVS